MSTATITPTAELALLRDALGVDAVAPISAEPLGRGTVSGFALGGDGSQVHYLDTSAVQVPVETGLALVDDEGATTARIWMHPADPHLPALAATAFSQALDVLLARLGIALEGPAEMIAYRPGRRAVLRAPTSSGTTWIKVVRPRRIAQIVRAHEACSAAGLPVPRVRGWSAEGLLVLDSAAGVPAAEGDWAPLQLLDATDALRTALARIDLGQPVRSVTTRLGWYAQRVGPDALALVQRIGAALDALPVQEPRTVHGDLHYGQLFLTDGAVSGVIDLDTLGRGAPAEDSAAFIAHAIASARLTPAHHASRVWALADEALQRWDADPGTRACTATHLVGHAMAAATAADAEGEGAFLLVAGRVLDGGPATPPG